MEITPKLLLNLKINEPDSGATTPKEYLQLLLSTLWKEAEGFSGKRPFGNSSWQWDLGRALIEAGVPIGTLDKDGYVSDLDMKLLDELVYGMIQEL